MANTYFKTAAKTIKRAIIKTLAILTLITSLLAIAACWATPRHDAQDTVQARVSAVQDVNGDIYLVCLKDASGAVYRCYVPRIDWVDMDATYIVTLDGDKITSIR